MLSPLPGDGRSRGSIVRGWAGPGCSGACRLLDQRRRRHCSATKAETRKIAPGALASPASKVALLLPLTGGNSQPVAKALKQAGELALFDFDNPNVELVPKDTRGTPEGAKSAAQEAVKEGAELIIGPLFANEVSAAAPEAQRAGIPMIAFSSDRKVAGNGVYLLSFLAGSDVPRDHLLCRHARRKRASPR